MVAVYRINFDHWTRPRLSLKCTCFTTAVFSFRIWSGLSRRIRPPPKQRKIPPAHKTIPLISCDLKRPSISVSYSAGAACCSKGCSSTAGRCRARIVPTSRIRFVSSTTANASDGKNSNVAPRASSTWIPSTAVINPRGINHTISSRSNAENPRHARRPACTAIPRATKIAAKHNPARMRFFGYRRNPPAFPATRKKRA